MQKIYNLLKNYTLQDALEMEKQDLQYKSLDNLYTSIQDKNLFLGLIIANSIVCYQLSSTGEEYWEEFSENASNYFLGQIQVRFPSKMEGQSTHIIAFLKQFLPNSKGNKRLLEVKIKRLDKLEIFLDDFLDKINFYTNNLVILRDELASVMNQKKDAKTIVFAIKMVMYGINISKNNCHCEGNEAIQKLGNDKVKEQIQGRFPPSREGQLINNISIPIDSRLTKIFEVYKEDYTDIKKFYRDLSIKLSIPEIHLDVILWMNYKKLNK